MGAETARDKLNVWWFDIRTSLWLIPSLISLAAVLLALIAVRIDQQQRYDLQVESTRAFGSGAEGARGVLTAIASTMMTVTALVFSIVVVAFQLAVSQLTPRVLRSVMADRGNQAVNDPTTATVVVDNLAALLVELAHRGILDESRQGDDGRVHLILHGPTFEEFVHAAFAQIAHDGAGDPVFCRRLSTILERKAALVP